MDFFNKLTKKASKAYSDAAEKTTRIAEELKLKRKISENKSKIEDIYSEIGKKVYQKHISSEEMCIKDLLKEECEKIDTLAQQIESYHEEIKKLSNLKMCVNCKETMDISAKFCPKCGAGQPEQKDEALEPEVLVDEVEQENDNKNNTVSETEKENISFEEESNNEQNIVNEAKNNNEENITKKTEENNNTEE